MRDPILDQIAEILINPSMVQRLASPSTNADLLDVPGVALERLVGYLRKCPGATTAGIMQEFANTAFGQVFAEALARYEDQEDGMPAAGSVDHFLQSREWKAVRMVALERFGDRCACCGRTAQDGIRINVDHIKPRIRYPELALTVANLQVLCDECNQGKGNRFQTDWRAHRQGGKPTNGH